MKNAYLSLIKLRFHFALMRLGKMNTIASFLLLISVATWLFIFPYLHHHIDSTQRVWANAKAHAHSISSHLTEISTPSTIHLHNFYQNLGDLYCTEYYVKSFYDFAKKNELVIRRAEYTLNHQSKGDFDVYRITVPLKGSYRSIRTFSEQILQKIPFASLDTISFKRDSIANRTPDAELRFSLYLTRAQAECTNREQP